MATVAVGYDAGIDPSPVGGTFGLALEGIAADALTAVVNGERAWSGLDELTEAIGGSARTAIQAAETLGWIVLWESCPQGPAYTLTPISADRLGLAIGPTGHWCQASSPMADGNYISGRNPNQRAEPGAGEGDDADTFGWLVDPKAIDPEWSAIDSEELIRLASIPRVRKLLDGIVYNMRLLGTGLAWPVVPPDDGICPACGTGRLDLAEICLVCHRSGLDSLARRIGDSESCQRQGERSRKAHRASRSETQRGTGPSSS